MKLAHSQKKKKPYIRGNFEALESFLQTKQNFKKALRVTKQTKYHFHNQNQENLT